MPTISIIVPVYKVEPYLRRCVDSILAQTFTDFELILVDDGSPDNCPSICDEYARQDSRIVVIHQENGGLSAARNTGIDWAFANSDSQWLSFIDSDDWVHPAYLGGVYNAAIDNDVSLSICGYAKTTGEEPQLDGAELVPQVWEPEAFYVQHTVNATVAWGKLYQKESFRDIRYPVGKLNEDEYITYRLIFSQKKLTVVFAPLYFYYYNPSSITNSEWSPRRLDALAAFDQQLAFFSENKYPLALKRRVRACLWMLSSQYYGAVSASTNYAKEIKLLRKKMKDILRIYASQIDHTWPEYASAFEIIHPHISRLHYLVKGSKESL